jgi:hypothetical protein
MTDLEALVADMRRLGVTKYKANGIEVELGSPPAEKHDARDLSEAEILAARKKQQQAELNMMFAHSSIRPRVK